MAVKMGMTKFRKATVVTGIVFAVFMTEALVHYSMAESKSERKTFMDAFKTLPDGNELLTMAAVVMAASIISGFLISEAEKKMGAKSAL
jgi:uncharacterized protein YcnI|tara:strand:- start:2700 stop:2966 length:267 start_codon:yes stop_codon:yes gene_type:complete